MTNEEWLKDLLKDGPVLVREIEQAARFKGISMKTAERAKANLGYKAIKQGKSWLWSTQAPERTLEPTKAEVAPVQPEPIKTPETVPSVPTGPKKPAFPPQLIRIQGRTTPAPQMVPLWAAMGKWSKK